MAFVFAQNGHGRQLVSNRSVIENVRRSFMPEEIKSRGRRTRHRRRRRLHSRNVVAVVLFLTAGVLLVLVFASNRGAGNTSGTSFDVMRSVPVLEMPARAVEIVKEADSLTRPDVIRDVIRAISVSARPGIMSYAVGDLLRNFPEDYEATLEAAAEYRPSEAANVADVAAQVCPDRAGDITFLLSRGAPENCVPVAVAVWRQTTGAENKIIRGLTNAVPRLAQSVDASTRFFGVTNLEFVLNNALDRLVGP